jgi:hypothetical protein
VVSAVAGNKAETKTMLPVIEVFMAVHDLPDVTVRPQDLMGHSGTTVTESVYRHEIRPRLAPEDPEGVQIKIRNPF